MGTRVRVGLVGQATGFKLMVMRIDSRQMRLPSTPSPELISKAAANLYVGSLWVNLFRN
jgi:hypothetical protein